jgi:hypothetical protein
MTSEARLVTKESLAATLRMIPNGPFDDHLHGASAGLLADAIFAALPTAAPEERCGYGCNREPGHEGAHLMSSAGIYAGAVGATSPAAPAAAPAEGLREAVSLDAIAEQRRLNWRDFHPERYCHRCGRLNVWSWSAPSPLWNPVMRNEDGSERFEGIVCPPCFALLCEQSGYVPPERHHWRFAPDRDLSDLSPNADGQVWDDEQWLWVNPAALARHESAREGT